MIHGKFHPSQRAWPSGMPDSIAQTEHKTPLQEAAHPEDSPLNLVHVYCPNAGCEWHVRVDEKVKEYNLTKHLTENCGAPVDWDAGRGGELAVEEHNDALRTLSEASGDEDRGEPKDSPARETEALRTAPVKYGVVCTASNNFFFDLSENDARDWAARDLDVISFEYEDTKDWTNTLKMHEPETKIERHPNSERFHQILSELGELHDRKQADYGRGDDPFANVRSSEEWGLAPWVGAMVRLNDKVRRLQSLAANGDLKNEAAEDSFRDIAVYSVIALVLYEQGLK